MVGGSTHATEAARSRADHRGELLGRHCGAEVPGALLLGGEHLVGLVLERELEPVEPHVGEALVRSVPAPGALQHVEVERE